MTRPEKIKLLPAIVLCISFAAAGFLFDSLSLGWLISLFFGIGAILILIRLIKGEQPRAFSGTQDNAWSVEMHDWGFCDDLLEEQYYFEILVEIKAFKEDELGYDVILLECIFADGRLFTISETHNQWMMFIKHLEDHLAIKAGWWEIVAKPTFLRNETVIYSRV